MLHARVPRLAGHRDGDVGCRREWREVEREFSTARLERAGDRLDRLAAAFDDQVRDRVLRPRGQRDADGDPRPLRLAVRRCGRRLAVPDHAPDFVGDRLVRRVHRQREVVVLTQFGVVEDAGRPGATLLPALDGVPVAVPADWLDAFVPRRRHRGIGQLCLDLGAQRRRLNAQTREQDEGGNTHRATLCCAARATGKRRLPPGWR